MNNWDFLELVVEHLFPFIFSFLCAIVSYWLLLKRYYVSLIDPLFISMVASSIGFSVVLFMYIERAIELSYLFSYLCTQLAFLFAFITIGRGKFVLVRTVHFKDEDIFNKILLFVSSLCYIIFQLLLYWTKGIPLFMESRLELFTDSAGGGFIARVLDVSGIVVLYLLFYFFCIKKTKGLFRTYLFIVLFFVFISYVLTGSKSAFLSIPFVAFVFVLSTPELISKRNNRSILRKYDRKILLFSISIVVLLFVIRNGGSFIEGFVSFLSRMLGYGDVYWYAYPNGCIESLNDNSPFKALFLDFLGVTRIYEWKDLPHVLGIDLYLMHHDTDVLQGPNSRHNIFGYVYFGFYGSILFSFCLGLIVGVVRKALFSSSNFSIIIRIAIAYLYINVASFETDIQLSLQKVDSMLLVYPILIIFSVVCLYFVRLKMKNIEFYASK